MRVIARLTYKWTPPFLRWKPVLFTIDEQSETLEHIPFHIPLPAGMEFEAQAMPQAVVDTRCTLCGRRWRRLHGSVARQCGRWVPCCRCRR